VGRLTAIAFSQSLDGGLTWSNPIKVKNCHPTSPTACTNPANWVNERRLTTSSFDMRQGSRCRRVLQRRL
jgi:hypothetical protein